MLVSVISRESSKNNNTIKIKTKLWLLVQLLIILISAWFSSWLLEKTSTFPNQSYQLYFPDYLIYLGPDVL